MSTIDFNQPATLTPEQSTAGLIEFGPGRSSIFIHSADNGLKIHAVVKALEARDNGSSA